MLSCDVMWDKTILCDTFSTYVYIYIILYNKQQHTVIIIIPIYIAYYSHCALMRFLKTQLYPEQCDSVSMRCAVLVCCDLDTYLEVLVCHISY